MDFKIIIIHRAMQRHSVIHSAQHSRHLSVLTIREQTPQGVTQMQIQLVHPTGMVTTLDQVRFLIHQKTQLIWHLCPKKTKIIWPKWTSLKVRNKNRFLKMEVCYHILSISECENSSFFGVGRINYGIKTGLNALILVNIELFYFLLIQN